MPTTGATFPGTGASWSVSPHDDQTWTNPGNIVADDTSYAQITSPSFDTGVQSYLLRASNFNFSAIPEGATIDGIIVRVMGNYVNGAGAIDLVQLVDAGGSLVGDNKASTPVTLNTPSMTVNTFGGAADTWNATPTRAMLQDVDFGVAIGCIAQANDCDIYIDYVTIEVYYTEGGSLQTITASGVVSEEAFGSGQVNFSLPSAGGIASEEAFGTPSVDFQLLLTGIASGEEFGTLTFTIFLALAGIESGEGFGSPAVYSVVTISPAGIEGGEAFGSPRLDQILAASSIVSQEAFGNVSLTLYLLPSGIASEEVLGIPGVSLATLIQPSAVESAEAFGQAVLNQIIQAAGIAGAEEFGAWIISAPAEALAAVAKIFSVPPVKRIFEPRPRPRVFDVPPRKRIFDRRGGA